MSAIEIDRLKKNSIFDIYSARASINMEPEYQRQGELWSISRQQLLIDSILNRFDLPKLYFHDIEHTAQTSGRRYKYAVIDGKQRLESIWNFLDGNFTLAEDFELYEDPKVKAGGLGFAELARQYPKLQTRIETFPLPISVVQTEDIEMIEEMFSRLNEAVPLNAPEKRNAFGGPLPSKIKELAAHDFFKTRLPFANNRYKHLDLATKLLYIEYRNDIVDTKKRNLDEFVKNFKSTNQITQASLLFTKGKDILSLLHTTFNNRDSLLNSVGMVVVYYAVARELLKQNKISLLNREVLVNFEELRAENKILARESQQPSPQAQLLTTADVGINQSLVEFDRLMQSPNDAGAIRFRAKIILEFLLSGGTRVP